MHVFARSGELPLFNPDIESEPPEPVIALWNAVTSSDAILVVSPEYAHGVTGTIKNTLDWLVGHPPFAHKPVAVFNPSYQSHHADDALKETLRTMSADIIADACIRVPVIGSGVTSHDILSRPEFASAVRSAIAATVAHVQSAHGRAGDA